MRKIWAGILGLVAVLAIGASPVAANKANDTLTVAVHDWWSTLDPYQFPLDEANVFYTVVYETLIGYDERAHQVVPRLAKAWRQIDDKTVGAIMARRTRQPFGGIDDLVKLGGLDRSILEKLSAKKCLQF